MRRLRAALSVAPCNPSSSEFPDLSGVPPESMDLKEVFTKARATSLPPHRHYYCAIDLLPGTSPPRGRIFSVPAPETKAMEKYVSDSLAAGLIRPSSSPAGAGVEEGRLLWRRRTRHYVPAFIIEV